MIVGRFCKHCGALIDSLKRCDARFCSEKCRMRHNYLEKKKGQINPLKALNKMVDQESWKNYVDSHISTYYHWCGQLETLIKGLTKRVERLEVELKKLQKS